MAARFTLEVFALKIVRAMELITILNHCYRRRGFVYQQARFGPGKKSIEVDVRPREGSAAICSGCHLPAPGYDHLPEGCFEFIPLWGFLVFLLYRNRLLPMSESLSPACSSTCCVGFGFIWRSLHRVSSSSCSD